MPLLRGEAVSLLIAIALAGVIDSTPTRICLDACGMRVGCLTDAAIVEGALIGERPAECPPPAVKLTPALPQPPPDPNATVCLHGILYFERTLTPVYVDMLKVSDAIDQLLGDVTAKDTRIAELEAALEVARKDAERMRRLDERWVRMLVHGAASEGQAAKATGLNRIELRKRADGLNAAIDAARAGNGGEG